MLLGSRGGRLALLDCGSVGRLSAKRREQVLVVLGSLVDADVGAVTDILMDWARQSGPPPPGLEPAVDQFFARYGAPSGRDIRLADAITEFIDRKSVVWGKSVSVRVDLGGPRQIKKKKNNKNTERNRNR